MSSTNPRHTNPEDFSVDPKVAKWIVGIFFSTFATVILFVIYFDWRRGSCSKSKEKFFRMEYHGKIVRKFRSRNHNYQTIEFGNGAQESLLFDYNVHEMIEPGDILIKKKNELNFKLIRGKDTMEFNEQIPDCEQFRED